MFYVGFYNLLRPFATIHGPEQEDFGPGELKAWATFSSRKKKIDKTSTGKPSHWACQLVLITRLKSPEMWLFGREIEIATLTKKKQTQASTIREMCRESAGHMKTWAKVQGKTKKGDLALRLEKPKQLEVQKDGEVISNSSS